MMKTKMICLHCGHVFDPEEVVNKYYDHATGTYDREECPNCGSEDIEEGMVCCVCEEVHREEDMIGEVCKECFEKAVTKRNAFRYGERDKQSVEINGFMAWVYDAQQIEHILEEHFKIHSSSNWEKLMVSEYCTDDKYDFADFLEEKGADK